MGESRGNCSSSSSSKPIADLFAVDDGIGVIRVVQEAAALLGRRLGLFHPAANCQAFNDARPGLVEAKLADRLHIAIHSLSTPTQRRCAS
uniref:Transposase n=1 Tax=Panagrellus redivivus TaxID=6233 RepID=A0A7E4VT58_PANRE